MSDLTFLAKQMEKGMIHESIIKGSNKSKWSIAKPTLNRNYGPTTSMRMKDLTQDKNNNLEVSILWNSKDKVIGAMVFEILGKVLYLLQLGTQDANNSLRISDFLISRIREHAAKLGAEWIYTMTERSNPIQEQQLLRNGFQYWDDRKNTMKTYARFWIRKYGSDMGKKMIINTVPEVSEFKVLYKFSSIVDSCSKSNFANNHANPLRIKQLVCGTEVHGVNNKTSLFLHMKSIYPSFAKMT